jgi:hypothetical protein
VNVAQDRRTPRIVAAVIIAWLLLGAVLADRAAAATSKACTGGGFALVLPGGTTVTGPQASAVPAAALGDRFLVRGRYIEFTVDSATLAVLDYTLTGAPNELDMTGGTRTVLFASKRPDLAGSALTSDLAVDLRDEDLVIGRTGPGISMKVQAKDCAQGGIFQMEPERADLAPTVITHTLGDGVFYFDNPFFRERIGQVLNGVEVSARVNFANDVSPNLVGRDSAQVADKLSQTRTTSVWSVASGGRMGGVLGEDAVEVAPPATDCVQDCQAQNRVRGQYVVLGFPFPVPAASRLTADGTRAGAAATTTPGAPAAAPAQTTPAAVPAGTTRGTTAGPAPSTASDDPAVQTLAVTPIVTPAGLLARGLIAKVRLDGGVRAVRIAVYRAAHPARALIVSRRAVSRGTRVLRIRFGDSDQLRRLTPGRYVVEVRAGKSAGRLGLPIRRGFVVVG